MKLKLATTTSDFGRYADSYAQILCLLEKTPFRYLDCGMSTAMLRKNPDLLGAGWQDAAKRLREQAESRGMAFVQAHAPMGRPLVKNADYEEFLFLTKRSVEIAHCLGAENIVVHSGYRPEISKQQCFAENKAFYELLFRVAEPLGIHILTENFDKMCDPTTYWVDNARDQRELIDYVNHPLFHGCWDTGHGNLQQTTQREGLRILGEHVYALHVQDNLGTADQHYAPYFGSMDLDSLMAGLEEIQYEGYFTFESGNLLLPETVRRQEIAGGSLAKPPVHLKLEAECLLYHIGEYILRTCDAFAE